MFNINENDVVGIFYKQSEGLFYTFMFMLVNKKISALTHGMPTFNYHYPTKQVVGALYSMNPKPQMRFNYEV